MKKVKRPEPKNLAEMFFYSAENFSKNEAVKYKVGHHYHVLNYQELGREVVSLAGSLKKLNFRPGDTAIILSENRPEWVITDLALNCLGVINVPIHSVLSSDQIAGIIQETKPKAIFFSDHGIEEKLLEIAEDVATVDYLISYESIGGNKFTHLKYFKDLIDENKLDEAQINQIKKDAEKIDGGNIASIIYTSGTTGHLKGVKLSHQNFIQDMIGVFANLDIYPTDRFFSILPLSHVFERTAGYYAAIYSGSSVGYCLDMANVGEEIKERRPTIVIAVPRLFEKIHEKIMAKAKASAIKALIFKLAFGYKPQNKNEIYEKIFDKLVFSKIRESFGGDIRFFVSGGAKLPEKLGKFFERAGLVVLEGYGLTETSPVIACNTLKHHRFGAVGKILPNAKVKIGPEEEILVKGPMVMQGYLREKDNAEAFTKDGWFRTGDLGFIDKDGYLVITGRKKDLIVLTTGKKIAPVPIEEALECSEYIEQAMVFGEGRKHIGAIIVPAFDKLFVKFDTTEKDKLFKNPDFHALMSTEIEAMTKNLASIEKIKKFTMIKIPFSVDNGDLTPTLKLRRKVILEKYFEEVEKVYF